MWKGAWTLKPRSPRLSSISTSHVWTCPTASTMERVLGRIPPNGVMPRVSFSPVNVGTGPPDLGDRLGRKKGRPAGKFRTTVKAAGFRTPEGVLGLYSPAYPPPGKVDPAIYRVPAFARTAARAWVGVIAASGVGSAARIVLSWSIRASTSAF